MHRHHIAIVGGGFAGVSAALAAAAELDRHRGPPGAHITLISPDDALVIKPRLYERDISGTRVPLAVLLAPVGVEHRQAAVTALDSAARRLALAGPDPGELGYDQLVVCAGSRLAGPAGSEDAYAAEDHLRSRALHDAVAALGEPGPRRAIVVGGGFTGIELAAELAGMLGPAGEVELLERGPTIAPDFGPRARAEIERALARLGVRMRTAAAVAGVSAREVTLAGGETRRAELVAVATGPRAHALAAAAGPEHDALGRVVVGPHLETGADGVWAAGDSACALVDSDHHAPMSCQHAGPQGTVAGANAAAALRGAAPRRYRQPFYVTCLDLGDAGALLTTGFARDDVLATGAAAKRVKRYINHTLIYPPRDGDRDALLRFGRRPIPGPILAPLLDTALRRRPLRALALARFPDRASAPAAG